MHFDLKVKKKSELLDDKIELSTYATEGSAGLDLKACIEEEVIIEPDEVMSIPTGIAIDMPNNNMVGLVFARSGLSSKYGINLVNGVGVIDSDYKGEIKVLLKNSGRKNYTINLGERIAQIVFLPIMLANLKFVDDLSQSVRGEKGFGSTGK